MEQRRIIYPDILRIISIFAVVVFHINTFKNRVNINSFDWYVCNTFELLQQFCVPVFVMISGMFMLDKDNSIKNIYLKILRLVSILFFWGVLYNLVVSFLINKDIKMQYFATAFVKILSGNVDICYQLWYLYLAICLYVATPVLRVFVKNSAKNELLYFIIISFIVGYILPFVSQFYDAVNKWINYIPFFTGFVGYYVLGYYLKKYDIENHIKYFIYAVTFTCFLAMEIVTSNIQIKDASSFYGYETPYTYLLSVCVFVLIKDIFSIKKMSIMTSKLIATFSKYTFGVYLIHVMIITALTKYLNFKPELYPAIISIPVFAIIVFIAGMLGTFIVSKIPVIKNLI